MEKPFHSQRLLFLRQVTLNLFELLCFTISSIAVVPFNHFPPAKILLPGDWVCSRMLEDKGSLSLTGVHDTVHPPP